MARNSEGAAAGTVRPPISTPPVSRNTSPLAWRVQLVAARYALSLEMAGTVAVLALGAGHG